MVRNAFVAIAFCVLFVLGLQSAPAQATKKLKEKSETAAQQKSWDQVDKINGEADATRARREQAQRQGDQKRYTGGNITKSSVFPKSPKQKDAPKKQDSSPKKKKKQPK